MTRSAPPSGQQAQPRPPSALLIGVAAGATGLAAAIAANVDAKAQLVAIGLAIIAGGIVVVRDRSSLVLFMLVVQIQLPFIKAIGPAPAHVGGAPGFYIATTDVLLLILYWIWWSEGTMKADLQRLFASRWVLVPLLMPLSALPSLFAADSIFHGLAEIARIGWGFLLYVYIAGRLRTRREIGVLLTGLFVVALLQGVLVLWQWHSGSTGTAFFGQEAAFTGRVSLEGEEIVRPSGTLGHPAFLGAVVGPIALLALSLAMIGGDRRFRIAAGAAFTLAVLAIGIAQIRATMLGLGVGIALILWVQIRRGHVSRRGMALVAAVILVIGVLGRGPLTVLIQNNIGTEHFGAEVDVRVELMEVAMRIVADSPLIGIGLNNYTVVKEKWEPTGVSLPILPVHNYFLLTWAETGILGIAAGAVAAGFVFLCGLRLALTRDPFLSSAGIAVAASVLFYAVEEFFSFAFRVASPDVIPWLLAGLAIAGMRILQQEGELPRFAGGATSEPWPVLAAANLGRPVRTAVAPQAAIPARQVDEAPWPTLG
jgi:hypothetical protein